jgi:hypothetical protein
MILDPAATTLQGHTEGTPFVHPPAAPPPALLGTPFVSRGRTQHALVLGTSGVILRRRSILERWLEAWQDPTEAKALETTTTTLNILRGTKPIPLDINPPSAWVVAQQLRRWLGVTFDDLSAMTAIGTSTLHSWSDTAVVPRPSKVRSLWRLFTLVRSLESRLGSRDAAAWMRVGTPSPLERLVSGGLEEVERLARTTVLQPLRLQPNPFMSARIEDGIETEAIDHTVPRRAAGSMRRSARSVKVAKPRRS